VLGKKAGLYEKRIARKYFEEFHTMPQVSQHLIQVQRCYTTTTTTSIHTLHCPVRLHTFENTRTVTSICTIVPFIAAVADSATAAHTTHTTQTHNNTAPQLRHWRTYAEDVLALAQGSATRAPVAVPAGGAGTGSSAYLLAVAPREGTPEVHQLEMRRKALLLGCR
jgi:hypothetical protein